VGDHRDSYEEKETRHEYRVEFLCFSFREPREGTVLHLVFLLVMALRPFAARAWAAAKCRISLETAVIRPAPPDEIPITGP
jgi:hypothetical protein